jgi:nitroimidazol reductase NimA-like FMN-containing flavoprotein (pyridoxamine 5'-phosphate oxidase superfamily)
MTASKSGTGRREMERVLTEETMGFLGLAAGGRPYVVPMTYGYVRGTIYLHCALTGKKLDCLRGNPRVCFTVARQYGRLVRHPQGAGCPASQDSVICYGKGRILKDVEERRRALTRFNRCLQPGVRPLRADEVRRCYALEIKVDKMTGRRQRRGGDWTRWEYRFPAASAKK